MANASKKPREEGRKGSPKSKPGAESDTKKGEIRVQPGGRGEGFGGFGEAKKYSQR